MSRELNLEARSVAQHALRQWMQAFPKTSLDENAHHRLEVLLAGMYVTGWHLSQSECERNQAVTAPPKVDQVPPGMSHDQYMQMLSDWLTAKFGEEKRKADHQVAQLRRRVSPEARRKIVDVVISVLHRLDGASVADQLWLLENLQETIGEINGE